jgi:hypothetical protein
MKHFDALYRSFRLASVCCVLLACSAIGFGQQQSKSQTRPHAGRISVPFEFDVGGTKFPAGQYILGVISPSYGQIRSADGKTQQTLYFVQTGEPEKNPRALFVLRGKKYFFFGVLGWFGRMQYTGFSPHTDDEPKEIPITAAE